jgi:hypothetical protein
MQCPDRLSPILRSAAFLMFAVSAVSTLSAQVVLSGTPVIGSSNTVNVAPPVPKPATRPCGVELFKNLEFANFDAKIFSYTPPKNCPGPWAKVVFSADFTVTKGTQFDRTGQFFLGGANLFYGTTPEPRSSLSPSWHVESDVTDLSAIFKTPQTGSAILGNYVGVYNGVDYNGIIYGNASLAFYPLPAQATAATTPSVVIGLPGNGGAATLSTSTSVYSQSVTLPTNVTSAYLDVFAQGQSQDEFWYFNVPNDLTSTLEDYGNTAFRETEIAIDGTPAGVAPIYPWVFTGGVDPFLWEPLPGFQTLNFKPFRVNLTPFAGLLSDGNPHTITLSVYNADNYFLIAANLLAYTDPVLTKVKGYVTENTLEATPVENITDNLNIATNGDVTGPLKVASPRSYRISGFVSTSAGEQRTTVQEVDRFVSTSTFTINSADYIQDVDQNTTYSAITYTTIGNNKYEDAVTYSYPFTIDYGFVQNQDGTYAQNTKVSQQYISSVKDTANGVETSSANTAYVGTAQDTLNFDSGENFTGISGTQSVQNYVTSDSTGYCYNKTMVSAGLKLTSVTTSSTCN